MSVLDEVLKDLAEIGAVGPAPLLESKHHHVESAGPATVPRIDVSRVVARINLLRERLDDAETAVREVKMTLFEIENDLDLHGEGQGHGKFSKKS